MKKSLRKMLLVPPITLIVLFGIIIYYFCNISLINPLVLKKLNADFSMGYDLLNEKYPGEWAIKDNSLYKGAQLMNDHSELVDKIKRSCGSEATIFQKNVRVATSILKEDGTRAVGTKVSPEVESMVLLQGKEYIGQAIVVGKPFQTKYMPLKDKDGNIVGMWFIGVSRQDVKTFNIQLGLFIGLIVVIALVLITLVSTTIDKKIKRIAGSLVQGVREINLATGQVSSASQSLAEGASEQAAAIEETSSSLEEMASMTKQNADNAVQADHLMKETNSVVTTAAASMSELTGSMADISKSSGETSKIIKTIDEIAFQTNLLALNAAVEAARAGEAGAGFAVVADEVRSLAMRAAAAAKNTADLIEDTVKKINHGSQIVAKTNTAFEQVAHNSSKVGSLVSEISAASSEQASGIGQINKAVAEMDKVVQQNAANAEETAAAGEELNAQATDMKSVAGDLIAIVTGEQHATQLREGLPNKSPVRKSVKPAARPMPMKALTAAPKKTPQQIIPMDEDDFQDF